MVLKYVQLYLLCLLCQLMIMLSKLLLRCLRSHLLFQLVWRRLLWQLSRTWS